MNRIAHRARLLAAKRDRIMIGKFLSRGRRDEHSGSMSDPYSWVKLLHIVSSAVLFGTGLGTAFQMWMAHLSATCGQSPPWLAIPSSPISCSRRRDRHPTATGLPLWLGGFDPLSSWLIVTYALYALAGDAATVVCSVQVRNLTREAVAAIARCDGVTVAT